MKSLMVCPLVTSDALLGPMISLGPLTDRQFGAHVCFHLLVPRPGFGVCIIGVLWHVSSRPAGLGALCMLSSRKSL